MARIAGVDLPNNKRGEIGLTYIFGIGRSSARKILSQLDIDFDTKVGEWNDEQIAGIRSVIANEYKIEGELRSSIQPLYRNQCRAERESFLLSCDRYRRYR